MEVDTENEPDRIKHSYDVFIKPHISHGRQAYILQFPNRAPTQNYSAAQNTQPLKMRVKPEAKMVELDVPVDVWNNYDKTKGVKWGDALKKSNFSKGGGSYGLPGGFGIGGQQPSGRGRGKAIDDENMQERILEDYAGAVKNEMVLARQTLGGQAVPNEETTPQYMIGTFKDNQLHLIPVDSIVQMRPQFHHIDAQTEQDRISRGKDANVVQQVKEARAVHMTVKSSLDEDEEGSNEKPMSERIAAAQSEQWKVLSYQDEESEPSWHVYAEEAFAGAQLDPPPEEPADLKYRLPGLKTSLDEFEYLDAISGPRDAERLLRSQIKKERDEERRGKRKERAGSHSSSSDSEA